MQMLQQHAMLKRLQELQRHQQLQELGDGRQQNYLNQLPAMNKQASGGQFLPLINGMPIHDASQMFMAGNMNLVQRRASSAVQGFPNGLYSHAQSQDLHSMGLVPQQLDESLYGTPIGSAKNNFSQYSRLQGLSHDSVNGLIKGIDNQAEKPITLSPGFSNSFLGDHCNVSSDQLSMPEGASMSKQVFHEKDLFGQVPLQGFNGGVQAGSFQQVNTLQRNTSVQELNGRQEQAGWPGLFHGETTQVDHSQVLTTLDPLEQKILFNMDDNSWNSSFGKNTNMGTGGFGTDYVGSFPSTQSGSWSALMQSAVAEASSSDNGLQEEWSGLSFQNTELSTDNQHSNFLDSGKQQTGWVDNNVQSASSLSSKPQLLFNDSNASPSFHGFQQSGIQFTIKQRDAIHSDSSPESVQQSPKNAVKWLDCSTQRNQSIEGSHLAHKISPLENSWQGQSVEYSERDAHQQSKSSYDNSHKSCNKLTGRRRESPSPIGNASLNACGSENSIPKSWTGDLNGVVYKEKGPDSFYNSLGRLEQVKSCVDNRMVEREDSQLRSFAAVRNSSTTKADKETGQHDLEYRHLDYMKHADIYTKIKGNENMADNQHQLSGNQVSVSSYEGAAETYEKQFDHSSISQHSGIRSSLSQWMPSNSSFSSQSFPQMVRQANFRHVNPHLGDDVQTFVVLFSVFTSFSKVI